MVVDAAIRLFISFCKDSRGATSIEYALIGGLVSIAIVAGATGIGKNLIPGFETLVGALKGGK